MATDKPKADFGNVKSSVTSTAPAKPKADFSQVSAAVASTAPILDPQPPATYVVKSGDSLSKIAKKTLGSPNKWKALWEANKDQIKDPDKIYPGQVLKLPPNA